MTMNAGAEAGERMPRERAMGRRTAERIVFALTLLAVSWLGGTALGRLRAPDEAADYAGPEGAERLHRRFVGATPQHAFFASGFGRQLLDDSEHRPVAILFIQWSECLSCAVEMVEWADESRRVPGVRPVEILTRKLPPDVHKFLAETGASVPVHVDSALAGADVAPLLPLLLFIEDRKVRVAYSGKGWSWRFWSDIRELSDASAASTVQ